MKKLLTALSLILLSSFAFSQSTMKTAVQEIRLDTLRPNHYGPNWGIVTAFHDTVVAKTYRDSVVWLPGGVRRMKLNSSGLTVFDTLFAGYLSGNGALITGLATVTKPRIIDSLNALSPSIANLTSQFRFANVANDFFGDTVSAAHGAARARLNNKISGAFIVAPRIRTGSGLPNAS